MADDQAKRLAQLKHAYENGAFDEDTYNSAVEGIIAKASPQLTGSGAMALQGSTAAGAGGVAVGGDVHGGVYIGFPPSNRSEEINIYFGVLARSCGKLPMRGKDVGASDPGGFQKPLGLVNVYIDLDTRTHIEVTTTGKKKRKQQPESGLERETRPLGALEAVIANRSLVLLGDPGGGKTTFVQHLAHCLAMHGLEPDGGWLGTCIPGWIDLNTVPIPVILRDFARALPDSLPFPAQPHHVTDFIAARLNAQNMPFAVTLILEALDKGRALVLLDGLDEVPTVAQRNFVRDAVSAFRDRYPDNRFLVTCRVLSYQPPATKDAPDPRLAGFPVFELAPFDEARIDRFIHAWYTELAAVDVVALQDADELARQLCEAVRRPDLWRLAPNPLLLTVMALVHAHKGRLPDARALLYEDTVDILLWRWEQIKAAGENESPRLRQLLLEAGRTDVDLKKTLWQLAYDVHFQTKGDGADDLADIGELKLQKALEALKRGDFNWARQMMETMKLRAGLLLERAPELFTFPHRTFQEYLAGAHLASRANFAQEAGRLAGEGALWREVILLAVGRLVYLSGDTDKPFALVGELCPEQSEESEGAWRKAWLAGDVLNEIGVQRLCDSRLGCDLLSRVQKRLSMLLDSPLAPRERAAAGDTLARLGDLRPGVGLRTDGLPGIVWCNVPAGLFTMGNESSTLVIDLPVFRISRYPVTNAQYAVFVRDGGYTEKWRDCWTEAGWREKGKRLSSDSYGRPFDLPNHPMVGISWYEATAFCAWLTKRLRQHGDIQKDQVVRLPKESEWEKAARGTDGRTYPWGEGCDAERANYKETGINSTSAAGCFPSGVSPYGVLDMAGNVWEWCARKWQDSCASDRDEIDDEGDDTRALRGGSYFDDVLNLRYAAFGRSGPDGRGNNAGFRIVLSPI